MQYKDARLVRVYETVLELEHGGRHFFQTRVVVVQHPYRQTETGEIDSNR